MLGRRKHYVAAMVVGTPHVDQPLDGHFPGCITLLGTARLTCTFIQDGQKVSVHLMITEQKTRKNILNSFSHLP
jgi:hypothetical protein